MRRIALSLVLILLLLSVGWSQDATAPKKNPPVTSRLAAAKTAFIRNARGSAIPFNSIASSMDGWGRFVMVNSAEEADLVIEVSSPAGGSGVSVSSKTDAPTRGGQPESSTTTSRDLSSGPIQLTVIDGKTKTVLWTASEQPKFAMRKKAQEDNLVEAAEKLFSKFHDRVEPNLGK